MPGTIYVSSGGAKAFAYIGVTYPAGSTLTCTNGSKTLTAKTTSGQWVFAIPEAGTWTVTATDGTNTKSETVEIASEGQSVSVVLSYKFVLFENGKFASGYAVSGGMSISGNYLWVGAVNGKTNWGYVSPAIDVTNYSTMRFIAKQHPIPNSGHRIGLGSSSGSWSEGYTAVIGNSIAQSDTQYSLDISALKGSLHFRMGMYSGNIYCSKVWFE